MKLIFLNIHLCDGAREEPVCPHARARSRRRSTSRRCRASHRGYRQTERMKIRAGSNAGTWTCPKWNTETRRSIY